MVFIGFSPSLRLIAIRTQDSGFVGQSQIGIDDILERCADAAASCHHHDIPAGLESAFVEAVGLPQAAADPVADHGMTQLFADGDAHPVGAGPVLPGVEYQIRIGLSGGGIQPPEYVVQFQAAGKFHSIRTTILISYFLIAMISLSVFAIVALHYTKKTVLENAESYSIQLINQVNSDIDSYMGYLRNTAVLISSNSDVHNYLFGTGEDARESKAQVERIVAQFKTIMDTRDDIVNIGIIGENGKYILNHGFFKINENVDLENVEWIQKAHSNQVAIEISSSHVQNVIDGRYEWVVTK